MLLFYDAWDLTKVTIEEHRAAARKKLIVSSLDTEKATQQYSYYFSLPESVHHCSCRAHERVTTAAARAAITNDARLLDATTSQLYHVTFIIYFVIINDQSRY